ncbi:MFS transporter [Halobium salinum]|uniref:MFS transporter n=1 Tax=Halobium salinum TaxID=1364940 RepID=A0ABD5P793_9EURY|nr:MFS transporter [Halobium salinum]
MTRRLFGTLCGLVFLVNLGRVVFAPLVETLQAEFGVGPAAVGLLTTLVWFGTALPRIPVGVLLSRVPRHHVVLGTGVLLAAGSAAAATAPTLPVLQAAAFVIGLSTGAYFVAAVPLVGELYPDAVGRAVGIHGTAAQVAAVAAPTLVVTVFADDWRGVFWLLGAGALLGTAVLFVLTVRSDGSAPAATGPDRDFVGALRYWREIALGVVLVSALGFVWQGVFNFYVSYLLTKGVSSATAGGLLTALFAAGVPAFWASGRLADRLPHVPYVLAIHAGFVCCLFALTLATTPVALLVVSLAFGLVAHGLFPALDAYLLGALPSGNRSGAYALYSGLALLLEANGSGAVGLLRGAGIPFDTVFRSFGVGLAVLLVALVGLYIAGRLPRTKRESPRYSE